MDNAKRLQYLQAMGIDIWVSRDKNAYQPSLSSGCHSSDCKEVEPAPENSGAQNDKINAVQISELIETDNWHLLQQQVAECKTCSLSDTRIQTVFGSGDRHAEWMLIGEAPGKSEDQQGQPFVGKAGLLLTEMLRAIGLARDKVFITNILKCRPPNNRDPEANEVAACSNFLRSQIAVVQPNIILAIGRIAAQNLLQTDLSLAKLRGIVHNLEDIPVIVIYHPAYLLRSLLEKRKAWGDLQMALKVYREIKPKNIS